MKVSGTFEIPHQGWDSFEFYTAGFVCLSINKERDRSMYVGTYLEGVDTCLIDSIIQSDV